MKFLKGNLLNTEAEALVNTVNTVGVMGKGIALQFKERFPLNFKIYAKACKEHGVTIGKMLVTKENTIDGIKTIINFPTKTEWFKSSQYSYIEEGLNDLVRVINELNIKSIAIPPLGCGNGGLIWEKVKPLMQKSLSGLDAEIYIYEPNEQVKEILQKEEVRKDPKLTPSNSLLLYSLFRYEKFGEFATVFVANKLAYFLKKSGEFPELKFVPFSYGPYAQAVDKILYSLNGKYLKGMEQMDSRPFERLILNYEKYEEVEKFIKVNLDRIKMERVDSVFNFINGFETPLSLEVLSSTHFLLDQDKTLTEIELYQKVKNWNERKAERISLDYIILAKEHLDSFNKNVLVL